jgi:zinc protease
LNAFTRKETTVYFLVVPSAELEQSIEIISQMLLHSTFPPEEFEKERKIVLEEIRKTKDDPASVRERFVERYLYRGSGLAEPIIGYPHTIETISREQVMSFYRDHYSPDRMRVYMIGGFDPDRARGWIYDYFSSPERSARPREHGSSASVPRWSGEVTVRAEEDIDRGFDMLIQLPSPLEPGFSAALLVSSMLRSERSPLPEILEELSLPESEVSLEVHGGFSALRMHIPEGGRREDYLRVPGALAALADWRPSRDELESARTAFLSSEVFDREKYHFYLMLHGEKIALFGDAYLIASLEGISSVGEKDCRRLLERSFAEPRFNACLIERAEADSSPAREEEPLGSATLDNGCRILSIQRTRSGVAAFHILIGGRNWRDSIAGRGMTVLLHHLLESSAAAREFGIEMERLGARLQWADNPYIPFDDYLLNPSYSFIRLEAPADKIERAIELLLGHLTVSEISQEDYARAMQPLVMQLRMREGSATRSLQGVIYSELFGSHPYAESIFPANERLEEISIDEIRRFRDEYVHSGGMVAALVSPLSAEKSNELLKRLLSRLPDGPAVDCPAPARIIEHDIVERPIDKEGAYLGAGWYHPLEDPDQAAALLVAAEILSRRMQQELREKQGLAYSTGCGVKLLPEGAVVIASIGTRAQNLETAQAGIRAEIERLVSDPPGPEEVRTAINRLVGRRSRSELSSINQAFAACRDLYITGETLPMKRRIERVTADAVRESASGSFLLGKAVFVRMIPSGEGVDRKMPPAMRMKMR